MAGVKEPTAKVKRALALLGGDQRTAAVTAQHRPWPGWVQRLVRRARSAAHLRPVCMRTKRFDCMLTYACTECWLACKHGSMDAEPVRQVAIHGDAGLHLGCWECRQWRLCSRSCACDEAVLLCALASAEFIAVAQAGPPQQRLFPQCSSCSDAQSAAVRGGQRTFVTHYGRLRRYHLAGEQRGQEAQTRTPHAYRWTIPGVVCAGRCVAHAQRHNDAHGALANMSVRTMT